MAKIPPFLATVPEKYREDSEESAFWDYVIEYLGAVRDQANGSNTELSNSLNDIYGLSPSPTFEDSIVTDDVITFDGARYRAVDASGITFSATAQDFVSASNGATVVLQDTPADQDYIKVGNADGSTIRMQGAISTNGGASTITELTSTIPGAIYDFQFSTAVMAWIVV